MTDATRTPLSTAAVIGRMQPPHLAHLALLRHALSVADEVLLILGSAGCAPSPDNPFSAGERQAMVKAALTPSEHARVRFAPVRDFYDQATWVRRVQQALKHHRHTVGATGAQYLVGHDKDASTQYLSWFPDYTLVHDPAPTPGLDSTALRAALLSVPDDAPLPEVIRRHTPAAVADWLQGWRTTPAFHEVQAYAQAVNAYRARWGMGPHDTADAVVCCAGHVLMIRRGGDAGHGQLALPGGFREAGEDGVTNALRECEEETSLMSVGGVGLDELRAGQGQSRVFDHPRRSPRAHLITQATVFHLDAARSQLPAVQARDDAQAVLWMPLADLPAWAPECFEDHANIIASLLGLPLD